MSLARTLIRNVAANWIGFAVQVVVTFLLTPFVLRTLGDSRYGAWSLLMGLTGYYGLLDLGFRAGVTQYMTRYLAIRDFRKLNETASTGFFCLAIISAGVAAVSVLLALIAPMIFSFPEELLGEIRWVIVLVGGAVAFQFPFFTFSAALTAKQRFDISNGIGIVTRLVTAALTVVLLKAGYGLIGISSATIAGNLLDYSLRGVAAYRVLPELSVRLRSVSSTSWWEFTHFGLWNVAILGSRRLITYSDTIVIGVFLPVAAIAPFAIAASTVEHFNRLLRPIATVFFPTAAELDARGEANALGRLYLVSSQLLLSFALVIGALGSGWADDFFRLWLGSRYAQGGDSEQVVLCFQLLLMATVLTSGQRIGCQVLLGSRRVSTLAKLMAAEAGANLALSVVLIQLLGVTGVAIGTLVPCIFFQMLVLPYSVCRMLGVPLARAFWLLYARPAALAVFLGGMVMTFRRYVGQVEDWRGLCLQSAAAGAMSVLLFVILALTPDQRRRLVTMLFSRLPVRTAAFQDPTAVARTGNAVPAEE